MTRISSVDLATALGLESIGAAVLLDGAASLDAAGPSDLGFVGNAKVFGVALVSKAGCLIATAEYPRPETQTILLSANPRADFARALELFYPPRKVRGGIHPAAVVDPAAVIDPSAEIGPGTVVEADAVIASNVLIGPGCFVGSGSSIGDGSMLHHRVTLYPRVTVGKRCIVHAGAVIGADGFGFEMQGGRFRKVPQVGTVRVGDDVEIGANTCIDRAALGVTVVGDGTKLDNMVHIAHNCVLGKHVVIAAQTGLAGGVTVGDYAVVGGQVGVGDKARIESKAVIGSGAGILTSKIVRAGEPVWGTPARPLRQYLAQLAVVSRLARQRKQHEAL